MLSHMKFYSEYRIHDFRARQTESYHLNSDIYHSIILSHGLYAIFSTSSRAEAQLLDEDVCRLLSHR